MEPPIGYGLAYRSIFPESHFRTTIGSDFSCVGGSWVFTRIGFCRACSTWRCATTSSMHIAAERLSQPMVWFWKSVSVPG